LEEPLTEVIALETKPPVHDSAKEILSFFLKVKLFFDLDS
jgi:hypothetical protein